MHWMQHWPPFNHDIIWRPTMARLCLRNRSLQ
jgi:hypothetical protein